MTKWKRMNKVKDFTEFKNSIDSIDLALQTIEDWLKDEHILRSTNTS